MPAEGAQRYDEDVGDLLQLWDTLWAGRRLILVIVACFAALSVGYALLAPEWYRAEVRLIPSESGPQPGLSGMLGAAGGLASLVGVNVGPANTAEPLAVLASRAFAREFIEDLDLLPVLYADKWDLGAKRWKEDLFGSPPDIHDAVRYFEENIRHLAEDKRTGLVTLAIEWHDGNLAAVWANLLVERLNARMQQRALQEADARVAYLRKELTGTELLTVQQSIGRLLEAELQKAMVARVNRDAAFRVVDPAAAPKWRSRPKRTQIVALAIAAGALLGCLVVLVRRACTERRRAG